VLHTSKHPQLPLHRHPTPTAPAPAPATLEQEAVPLPPQAAATVTIQLPLPTTAPLRPIRVRILPRVDRGRMPSHARPLPVAWPPKCIE